MASKKTNPPIIAVTTQKGGVGKSTTVINLAAEFNHNGYQVLVIDLDPQGNTTNHITGMDFSNFVDANIDKLICYPETRRDVEATKKCIINSNNEGGFNGVKIIPSAANLDKRVQETIKASSPRPDEELRYRLDMVKDQFDIILIDCPPSLTTLTNNAISAATHYITPIDTCTNYSLTGWTSLIEHVENITGVTNPDISYIGSLLTRHDKTKNVNKALGNTVAQLEQTVFGEGPLIPMHIHSSTKVGEASIGHKSMRKYARSNAVTKDYQELALFLEAKLNLPKRQTKELIK